MNKIAHRIMNTIIAVAVTLGGYSNALAAQFVNPPSVPVLVEPIKDTLVANLIPRFDWSDSNMPTGTIFQKYELQISVKSAFPSPTIVYISGDATNSEYTTSTSLSINKTYYWRVRAYNTLGQYSTWSPIWRIKTPRLTKATAPSVPVLAAPIKNSLAANLTPRFDWSNSNMPTGITFQKYELQLSDKSAFKSPTIVYISGDATNSEYMPIADLTANKTYYWRVRTYNTLGQYSAWSPVWRMKMPNLPQTTLTPTQTSVPPTPTSMPTQTSVPPNPTFTPTQTSVPPTPTFTPTQTSVPPTPTFTPTQTSVPPTPTSMPTQTSVPPTPTFTPTQTSVPPTATPTASTGGYFVSPTGNDSNPGTQNQPWLTIQKAANTAPIGSTVTVLAGNYTERASISRSITLQAQGQVVTRGFTVTANNVTIRGFEITNTADNSTEGWGIYVRASNCILDNNYIYYATRGGILLAVVPGSEALTANCIVRNNRLFRNSQVGIEVRGRNHLVEGNEIWGTLQHHPSMVVQPAWVDADGIRFHGSGHVFRGNYIHDILYSVPENIDAHIDCFQTFESLPYQEAASNILFEQNRCDNAQAVGVGKHSSGFMINRGTNITIRSNIIKTYVGLNGQNSADLTIVNNTFTSDLTLSTSYSPVGITFTNVSSSMIQNNIFYNLPGHIVYLVSTTGLSAGKNLVYRDDGQPLWTTSTYSHAGDLWGVNPLFISASDYHLLEGSPAIDAGYVVVGINDYDGNPRPQGQGYDIGAFEK